jgi:putative tRNA adenosine deaminase-associated protein
MTTITDFAVAAWREDGRWRVDTLPDNVSNDLDQLVRNLQAQPSESGIVGFLCVAEAFFIAVRVQGNSVQYLLSDVLTATEFPLAGEVLQRLDLPLPDEEDESQPAGDLEMFSDLGLESMEVAVICDDLELFPDEQLEQIAAALGFGEQLSALLETLDS